MEVFSVFYLLFVDTVTYANEILVISFYLRS